MEYKACGGGLSLSEWIWIQKWNYKYEFISGVGVDEEISKYEESLKSDKIYEAL